MARARVMDRHCKSHHNILAVCSLFSGGGTFSPTSNSMSVCVNQRIPPQNVLGLPVGAKHLYSLLHSDMKLLAKKSSYLHPPSFLSRKCKNS